ncbi:PurN, phosphoribosylglycinamide formyltransferase [Burkholderiaceae bacterium]
MKKILVVSDNLRLVNFFREECSYHSVIKKFQIDYKYSAKNKNPSELIALGMSPIDMKKCEVIREIISKYQIIFSLHCKQIFPSEVVNSVTCINIHPGLNPYNRGWYPQVFSIINKKPIGATIHLMDDAIDNGDIIDQMEVEVLRTDTSLSLYNRVYEAEKVLLRKNLLRILLGDIKIKLPKSDGNYNGIEDFKNLCSLNLDKVGTLGEHIDLLRALSHGDFKNAYFIDCEKVKKIYININLTESE